MGIISRCVNLFKADIHGVMDQLEDKGLLLKQYLRDMEEALAQKEEALNQTTLTRDRMKQELEDEMLEIEKLDQDITAAIKREKDDIARLLIKKSKSRISHKDNLVRYVAILDDEIAQHKECIEKQQLQYDQLRLKSEVYFREKEYGKMEKTISTTLPHGTFREPSEEEVELDLICRREALCGGEKR